MTETQKADMNSWDDFVGSWLKPDIVVSTPADFVVMKARADKNPQDEPQVVLTGNYNSRKFDFSLNKTNVERLKELKIPSPKACENKTLVLIKIKQRNPNTGKMQDSLFIDAIK